MPQESAGGPFDLDHLRQLMELMDKFDLSEVKLQTGDDRVILRRGSTEECGHVGFPMPMLQQGQPAHPGPPPAAAPVPPAVDENLTPIKSPTVGTFYQAAQPGDPAFVKPGDRVKSETVVCIIEAMKVFNQIPAKVTGSIVRVLVKDGDPVDFGQPLFLVKE